MNRIWRQTPIFHFGWSQRIAIGASCVFAAGLSSAVTLEFDVSGGELKPALDAYIAQSGVQLIYKIEDVKDLQTRGIKGKIANDAALDRLLDGTRLRIRRGPDGAMVLIAPQAATTKKP